MGDPAIREIRNFVELVCNSPSAFGITRNLREVLAVIIGYGYAIQAIAGEGPEYKTSSVIPDNSAKATLDWLGQEFPNTGDGLPLADRILARYSTDDEAITTIVEFANGVES